MSEIPAEGSVENPYRENPPTRFVEVHWKGGTAVKWGATSYVQRRGLTTDVPNSAKGTLSVWLKFYLAFTADHRFIRLFGGDGEAYLLDLFPGGYLEGRPDVPVTISARLELSEFFTHVGSSGRGFMFDAGGVALGAGSELIPSPWHHVYAEWDTNVGTFLLKVNGVTHGSVAMPASEFAGTDAGFGFAVPWGLDTLMAGATGVVQDTVFFQLPTSALGQTTYSLAEFWLDIDRTGVGVEKFIDVAAGRPKSLGANGELPLAGIIPPPTQPRPAFYFHRSGDPDTFCVNRGYAGEFFLVGAAPTDEPSAPAINPS